MVSLQNVCFDPCLSILDSINGVPYGPGYPLIRLQALHTLAGIRCYH
jgi:hypothetical protein